ncbi:universal stress protein [Paenarthrobacter ureafaciens]
MTSEMQTAPSNRHVVAALDGSVAGSFVADWAAARAHAMGDRLTLVHVVLPVWVFQVPDEHTLALKRAEDLLGSEAARVRQGSIRTWRQLRQLPPENLPRRSPRCP